MFTTVSTRLPFSKDLRMELGRQQRFFAFYVGIRGQHSFQLKIPTETWQNEPNSFQQARAASSPCSLPDLTEFPAYTRFLILVLKLTTLSVVLLKFILCLVLLPRSNKAFSEVSWSFPVLAMLSRDESLGHYLTTYC